MHLLTIILLTVWASCAQGQGGTCDFPKIKHGSIYNENRYEHLFPVAIGKYVYYSCEQSFASPKQSVWTRIECTAEGWSPDPQCLRHCILPSVEHGHSDYSQVTHLEGETVKITCDIGYSLPNNQRIITCTESGWSTEPICIPYRIAGHRRLFQSSETETTGAEPIPNIELRETGNKNAEVWRDLDFFHRINRGIAGHRGPFQGRGTEKARAGPVPDITLGRLATRNAEDPQEPPIVLHPFNPRMAWHWGPFQGHETETTGAGSVPNIERRETGNRNAEDWRKLAFLRGLSDRGIAGNRGPFQSSETETTGAGPIPNIELRNTGNGNAEGRWELPFPLRQFNTEFCYRPTFENARTESRGKRFRVNDHLEYDCHPGYENKHGNTSGTIVCGDSGWSDTPTCFDPKEKCGRPPAIDNGDITSMPLKEYAPGSLVKYQCQSYYKRRGNSTIICNKGKWTIPPECLDPCVISEDIMDKHNIQIQERRGKEIYFQWGETVKFMCKRGYQKQTEQKSFRATCMNGNLTYPKCE
ncbi:complement factor H-related protein 3 isoform X2 [Sorex fumeus]|uniref:complement factor H-related protein 3 isoform X2 n=1 Tax=Sorex fumeus TaxID=62283 RepID=UPI0024AD2050|nr:complement factor H-related protein 3 isoform X2 [Sorex fumeus]